MTSKIKDFYLNIPTERYEYIRIHIKLIPQEIINIYNLLPLAKKYHVLDNIHKGMYGLYQSGKIVHDQLIKHLAKFGYFPARRVSPPGTRQGCGITRPATYNVSLCCTNTASSTLKRLTPITLTSPSPYYTRSPPTGDEYSTSASPSNVTTKHAHVT